MNMRPNFKNCKVILEYRQDFFPGINLIFNHATHKLFTSENGHDLMSIYSTGTYSIYKMYIISDDVLISPGMWCYNMWGNPTIFKYDPAHHVHVSDIAAVIASTDELLYPALPRIPFSFVKYYASQYNKDGRETDTITVEYRPNKNDHSLSEVAVNERGCVVINVPKTKFTYEDVNAILNAYEKKDVILFQKHFIEFSS